jgi:hypothetical protein
VKLRDQLKQNPYGSLVWRVFIGVVGGLVTLLGTIFLFAPGPGILVLLAIRKTRSIAQATSQRIGIPLWVKYLIAAIGAVLSILFILVFHA